MSRPIHLLAFAISLLMLSCGAGQSARQIAFLETKKTSAVQPPRWQPPGQKGPTPALLQIRQGEHFSLKARRSDPKGFTPSGSWILELFKGQQLIARWPAVSGYESKQTADRLWTPGNGAPLPIGTYALGQPEPWGTDLWLNLAPQFETDRSGLGIHNCNPGSGCLCIPNRNDLKVLANWVKATKIQKLRIID
ncbi:MAG: hypothetical protein CMP86_15565 [Gammaproteobacteria bacterium]|nr:hypothetical protein [Gammaproteobacteria bacterium]